MRYYQVCERITKDLKPEVLQQAAADGFDTKIWYHGTTKRFADFREPNGKGVDELGPGIYITDQKLVANTWARKRGFILSCVIKSGPLFDLGKLKTDRQLQQTEPVGFEIVWKAHSKMMDEKFGPNSAYEREMFARAFHRRPLELACLSLPYLGYVGGYDRQSQIPGQLVIFRPSFIRILAREAGE